MKLNHLYYQAFSELRKHTHRVDAKKHRKKILESNNVSDKIRSLKYTCHIDSDWILEIEKGMVFIEKAIREDRQFIKTEGNVIPIEKVKKTSKDTVEHLSRHSDLITKMPENQADPLIPDKLYVVEKLSDYLVYENRFIYMLLLYLKDFIELRITQIKEKVTSYHMEIDMDKHVESEKRQFDYTLTFKEVIKLDPYLVTTYYQIPYVKQMEDIYAHTLSMLSTDLMKQVAKAPVIKPPVVKTNVLRMNQNFKAALALYDFVTSYTKLGYELIEDSRQTTPFETSLGDKLAETIELTHMIGYVYGQDIQEFMEAAYQKELEEARQVELKKQQLALFKLKKQVAEHGYDPLEYMVQLEHVIEKQNIQMEALLKENSKLTVYEAEIISLKQAIQQQTDIISNLEKVIVSKDDAITEIKYTHQTQINQMIENHELTVHNLHQEHQTSIQQLNQSHEEHISHIKIKHDEDVQTLNQQFEAKEHTWKETISQKEDMYQQILKSKDETEAENQKLTKQNQETNARYYGLRQQYGLNNDVDFTSKAAFKALELEFKAYKLFFDTQWKKTKVRIRKALKEKQD